jgi:hypothetical protein
MNMCLLLCILRCIISIDTSFNGAFVFFSATSSLVHTSIHSMLVPLDNPQIPFDLGTQFYMFSSHNPVDLKCLHSYTVCRLSTPTSFTADIYPLICFLPVTVFRRHNVPKPPVSTTSPHPETLPSLSVNLSFDFLSFSVIQQQCISLSSFQPVENVASLSAVFGQVSRTVLWTSS